MVSKTYSKPPPRHQHTNPARSPEGPPEGNSTTRAEGSAGETKEKDNAKYGGAIPNMPLMVQSSVRNPP